jgi:hypothetical protein
MGDFKPGHDAAEAARKPSTLSHANAVALGNSER